MVLTTHRYADISKVFKSSCCEHDFSRYKVNLGTGSEYQHKGCCQIPVLIRDRYFAEYDFIRDKYVVKLRVVANTLSQPNDGQLTSRGPSTSEGARGRDDARGSSVMAIGCGTADGRPTNEVIGVDTGSFNYAPTSETATWQSLLVHHDESGYEAPGLASKAKTDYAQSWIPCAQSCLPHDAAGNQHVEQEDCAVANGTSDDETDIDCPTGDDRQPMTRPSIRVPFPGAMNEQLTNLPEEPSGRLDGITGMTPSFARSSASRSRDERLGTSRIVRPPPVESTSNSTPSCEADSLKRVAEACALLTDPEFGSAERPASQDRPGSGEIPGMVIDAEADDSQPMAGHVFDTHSSVGDVPNLGLCTAEIRTGHLLPPLRPRDSTKLSVGNALASQQDGQVVAYDATQIPSSTLRLGQAPANPPACRDSGRTPDAYRLLNLRPLRPGFANNNPGL